MEEVNRYEVIKRLIRKEITEEEARKMIELKSTRQIRRIKKRVIKEGAAGVIHRNRGRPSNRKLNKELVSKITGIYQEKYSDFGPTLASEKLAEIHNIKISSESLRKILIEARLWKVKERKNPKIYHTWRERKSNFGEMQQYDGCYHFWLEDRGEECCLLLSVDDATSEITKAKFTKNEGVVATFHFWKEYAKEKGLPLFIYLDKFSTYKINHKSAQDNSELLTQFQRAMKQLDIKTITAHSPQAKGRVERAFNTLQDRLVKELRLRGISNIEEANKFLEEEYIDTYNQKFAVAPKNKANFHKKLSLEAKSKLKQIFSIQSTRKVQNDYTIRFKNKYFQLEQIQNTTVFKKDSIIVEEHLDGNIFLRKKDKYLKFKLLPGRPRKEIDLKLIALTKTKPDWIPPQDHPWRSFKVSNKPKIKEYA